jgi:hypothetical protein
MEHQDMDHSDYYKRNHGDISHFQLKVLLISFAVAALVLFGIAGLVVINLH